MFESLPLYKPSRISRARFGTFAIIPSILFDMSLQLSFSSTIHLRDFVDTITDDPTRENAPNYVEIQTEVNIFEESSFYSSNVNVEPIRTRIHAYLTREDRELYVPNAFFYADGRFSAALSADGALEISVQALSLMRHVPSCT
jgi:hypothetical protein